MADATVSEQAGGAAERVRVHRMQCTEVWGGNRSARNMVAVPGMDVWVYAEPYQHDTQGGDIHYLSTCGAGNISRLALADVSGHGRTASDMSRSLRDLMRKHLNTLDQTKMAQALNAELSTATSSAGRFATALLCTYFAPTKQVALCNAGHPKPLWYDASDDEWSLLDDHSPDAEARIANLPLGVIDGTDYHQFAVTLSPGDMLVVYTDALIEASNAAGDMLESEGLLREAKQLGRDEPQRFGDALLKRVGQWRSDAEPADDETLMVLHHNGHAPSAPSLTDRLKSMAHMLGFGGMKHT